jgi:hypothetical protein
MALMARASARASPARTRSVKDFESAVTVEEELVYSMGRTKLRQNRLL